MVKSTQHSYGSMKAFPDLCRRHPVKTTGAALVALQQTQVRVVPGMPSCVRAGGLQRTFHCHTINANIQFCGEHLKALYRHSCISEASIRAM